MCLVDLLTTNVVASAGLVMQRCEGTCPDGWVIPKGTPISILKRRSLLSNTSVTNGRTRIRCSDCEAVFVMATSPRSDRRGFNVTVGAKSKPRARRDMWRSTRRSI